MNLFFQILYTIGLLSGGFLLGWICRSILHVKEKDCANPAHQDWDYRKERQ